MVNDNNDIIKEISFYTQISEDRINDFINQSTSSRNPYYKHKVITKKDGRPRHLFMPTAELKYVQHFLVYKYFSKCPVSKNATAYIKGKSLLDNVKPHLFNEHFLFIDIRHFFDSIDFNRMVTKISSSNYLNLSSDCITKILKICSKNGRFVQGNVSSPMLSNIFMKSFDDKLEKMAASLPNGVYTRYSDDIIVSSSQTIPSEIFERIKLLISEEDLSVNDHKTRFSSYLEKIKITGIRIRSDKKPTLDTKFKKMLKNKIFHYLKYGKSSSENPEQILGLLSYLKMVDLPYYNKLNYKYKRDNNLLVGYLKKCLNKN